jgi:hypothetical protein
MAIVLRGATSGGVAITANPQTYTLPVTTNAGDTIVVSQNVGGSQAQGTFSGAGATWTRLPAEGPYAALHVGDNCTAGQTTITLSGQTSPQQGTVIIAVFSGLSTSSVARWAAASAQGANGATFATPAVACTPGGSQIVLAMHHTLQWATAPGAPVWSSGDTDSAVDHVPNAGTQRQGWVSFCTPVSATSVSCTSPLPVAAQNVSADVIVVLTSVTHAIADSATALDSLTRASARSRTIADGGSAVDALAGAKTIHATSDGAAAQDALTGGVANYRITDSALASDSLTGPPFIPAPDPPKPPSPARPTPGVTTPLTYRFFDLVTLDWIEALPLVGVELGATISTPDTLRGTFIPSDPRAAGLNWRRATQPNKALLVIDVLGQVQWSGIVQTRVRTKTKQTVDITCATADAWMKQRLQATEYAHPPPGGRYWAANPADPIAIAAQVIYDALMGSATMPTLDDDYCGIGGFDWHIRVNNGPVPPITGCIVPAGLVTAGSDLVLCFGRNECVVAGSSNVSGAGIPGGTKVTAVTEYVRAAGVWHSTSVGSISSGSVDIVNVVSPYPLEVGMLMEFGTHFPSHTYVAGLGDLTRIVQPSVGRVRTTATVGPGAVTSLPVAPTTYDIPRDYTFLVDGDPNDPPVLFTTSVAVPAGSTVLSVDSVNVITAIPPSALTPAPLYSYASVTATNPAASSGSAVTGTIGGWFTIRMSHQATVTGSPVALNFSNGTGPTPTAFWINGKFAKHQGQTVEAIIHKMSEMGYEVGFDYSFDIDYHPGSKRPRFTVNLWYPTQGKQSPVTIINSAWCSEYVYTEDGTQQASGTQETGKGLGGRVTGAIGVPGIPTNGYMLTESASTHTAVSDLAELTALEEADLDTNAWPVGSMELTLPLALDDGVNREDDAPKFRLADFDLGDQITLVVDDTIQGSGEEADWLWPGGMTFTFQIQAWKATIVEFGTSTLDLTCIVPPARLGPGPGPGTFAPPTQAPL